MIAHVHIGNHLYVGDDIYTGKVDMQDAMPEASCVTGEFNTMDSQRSENILTYGTIVVEEIDGCGL